MMTSADWRVTLADDVVMMTSTRADVSRWTPGACSAWKVWRRVEARGGTWRRVECMSFCADSFGGTWWRVGSPMMVRFPREGRSVEDNLSGTCKNTIRATITAATVWQWSQDSEWRRLQVRNQRRWLKRARGLTANGCNSSCKGGSNCETKIIPMKTGLPRKSQSDGSDTILEILKDCIIFRNERIYISALYRTHKCAIQVKCSTSTSVLYK